MGVEEKELNLFHSLIRSSTCAFWEPFEKKNWEEEEMSFPEEMQLKKRKKKKSISFLAAKFPCPDSYGHFCQSDVSSCKKKGKEQSYVMGPVERDATMTTRRSTNKMVLCWVCSIRSRSLHDLLPALHVVWIISSYSNLSFFDHLLPPYSFSFLSKRRMTMH